MCKICTKFWRIWFAFGIYIGFIEFSFGVYIFDVTSTCMRFFFAAFRRAKSWHFTDSAFCIRRDDLTWNDSSNIIFSLAARSWKASPTNCQVSKLSNPWTLWSFKENMSKLEFKIFSAFFLLAWVQLSGFFESFAASSRNSLRSISPSSSMALKYQTEARPRTSSQSDVSFFRQ